MPITDTSITINVYDKRGIELLAGFMAERSVGYAKVTMTITGIGGVLLSAGTGTIIIGSDNPYVPYPALDGYSVSPFGENVYPCGSVEIFTCTSTDPNPVINLYAVTRDKSDEYTFMKNSVKTILIKEGITTNDSNASSKFGVNGLYGSLLNYSYLYGSTSRLLGNLIYQPLESLPWLWNNKVETPYYYGTDSKCLYLIKEGVAAGPLNLTINNSSVTNSTNTWMSSVYEYGLGSQDSETTLTLQKYSTFYALKKKVGDDTPSYDYWYASDFNSDILPTVLGCILVGGGAAGNKVSGGGGGAIGAAAIDFNIFEQIEIEIGCYGGSYLSSGGVGGATTIRGKIKSSSEWVQLGELWGGRIGEKDAGTGRYNVGWGGFAFLFEKDGFYPIIEEDGANGGWNGTYHSPNYDATVGADRSQLSQPIFKDCNVIIQSSAGGAITTSYNGYGGGGASLGPGGKGGTASVDSGVGYLGGGGGGTSRPTVPTGGRGAAIFFY